MKTPWITDSPSDQATLDLYDDPVSHHGVLADRRFWVSIILLVAMAGGFWSSSRYPALNEKAMMGGDTDIEALGFDVIWPQPENATAISRVAHSAVNWAYTNRNGMAFGLLFAAGIMCTISRVPNNVGCGNRFLGSVLGISIGAPLGVCVNCATPIGQGLHSAGARTETSLATMMSAPTLNVIVLAMLFTVLPFYMAVLKIGMTLLFLLIGLPLLVRWLGPVMPTPGSAPDGPDEISSRCEIGSFRKNGWLTVFLWLARSFSANLWFIVRKTLPWMALAGVLGAALVTFVPFDTLAQLLSGHGKVGVIVAVLLVAAFGLFLPVPMAFDVIVVAVLLSAGLEAKYAMVLLFTLGIFSVYPFAIIRRSYTPQLATGIAATLLVFGVGTGMFAHYWQKYEDERMFRFVVQQLGGTRLLNGEWPERGRRPEPTDEPAVDFASVNQSTIVEGKISVLKHPFSVRAPERGPLRFARKSGPEIGLNEPVLFSTYKLFPPFGEFRPISAGDIDNDGWTDILIGSDPSYGGISLFRNCGGKSFVRQKLNLPELDAAYVVNAALIDLNNDGWLDICVSTFRAGAFVLTNSEGHFSSERQSRLPLPEDTVMCGSLAFADLDYDGDLDIVAGRWSYGMFGSSGSITTFVDAPWSSTNFVLWNGADGEFTPMQLPGPPGETLSTLVSDIDGDGHADLLVGNDFDEPDSYYLGDGQGGLRLIDRTDGLIDRTTRSTMSLISCDIDNDLQAEFYVAQIGHSDEGELQRNTLEWIESEAPNLIRRQFNHAEIAHAVAARRNVKMLLTVEDPIIRQPMLANVMLTLTRRERRIGPSPMAKLLAHIDPTSEDLHFFSKHPDAPRYLPTVDETAQFIPQQKFKNLLWVADGGKLVDRANELGVAFGDWAWNSKFADLDNDQFADLYIANGWIGPFRRESNHFFQNIQGAGFENRTAAFGLTDRAATGAYCYVDFDNDGDMDIISVPINDEVRVFVNQTSDEHGAVEFQLRDFEGNHFGIGARIVIRYGPEGKFAQMREILSSGFEILARRNVGPSFK